MVRWDTLANAGRESLIWASWRAAANGTSLFVSNACSDLPPGTRSHPPRADNPRVRRGPTALCQECGSTHAHKDVFNLFCPPTRGFLHSSAIFSSFTVYFSTSVPHVCSFSFPSLSSLSWRSTTHSVSLAFLPICALSLLRSIYPLSSTTYEAPNFLFAASNSHIFFHNHLIT